MSNPKRGSHTGLTAELNERTREDAVLCRVDIALESVARLSRYEHAALRVARPSDLATLSDRRLVWKPEAVLAVAFASAVDGLLACRFSWHGAGRRTQPVALGTLLRQSIQGSATVLWLLDAAGDRADLRRRYAGIAIAALDKSLGCWKALRDAEKPGSPHYQALDRRFSQATAQRACINVASDIETTKVPNDTDLWRIGVRAAQASGAGVHAATRDARLQLGA